MQCRVWLGVARDVKLYNVDGMCMACSAADSVHHLITPRQTNLPPAAINPKPENHLLTLVTRCVVLWCYVYVT